jgi:hypothetical protein
VIDLQLGEPLERRFPSPFFADSGAPPNGTDNRDGNQSTNNRDGWHGWGAVKELSSVFFQSRSPDFT